MRLFSPKSNDFPVASSAFEKEVFRFCSDWNEGKAEFQFHSSGSTGAPKSISLTRAQMISSAELTGQWLALAPRDVAFMALPVQYIAGAMVLVRALVLDLDVLLVEPCQNPLVQVQDASIQLASFVPTQWATILNSSIDVQAIFSKAKGVLIGGASLDPSLEKASFALDFPLFHTYGMTETVSHVAYRDLHAESSYFHCLPGVEIQLNTQGCLMVQGSMTANQWIETNDLVHVVDEYTFEFVGRADRVINSGGKKIFPDLVEKWVRQFYAQKKWTAEILLVGLPDSFYGQKAVLFTTMDLSEEEKNQVTDFLKAHLASEDCPKAIVYRPRFELLENGKIDALKTVALYVETTK